MVENYRKDDPILPFLGLQEAFCSLLTTDFGVEKGNAELLAKYVVALLSALIITVPNNFGRMQVGAAIFNFYDGVFRQGAPVEPPPTADPKTTASELKPEVFVVHDKEGNS
jgi:hypothetical protein